MATTLSREDFLRNLVDSTLLPQDEIASTLAPLRPSTMDDGAGLAEQLIAVGKLTRFQADAIRERRFEELVIGNYQVLDRLGAGAMGTVYKARHRRMKREVALKLLSREIAKSPKLVQRFQREVEAVARLNHPNIVMAHDADEAEAGHFLVMEFVNGRDLATEVQQRGPLPVAEAVDCILQAARGLAYAHEQGVIHRDIKPANLLRDVGGVVKVADLGLARFNDSLGRPPEEMAALTQAGTIMGTIDFMSPEQALGLTNIDHRTDIYSLGCTLYFLLNAGPPYRGSSLMAVLLKHREAPIPSLSASRSDVPAALQQVFRRMLAKKPKDRPSSLAEVVRDLEALAPSLSAPHPVPPAVTTATVLDTNHPSAQTDRANQTVDLPPAAKMGFVAAGVLLVEPSRTQQGIVRKYLQELGYASITTATSGEKALEMARSSPPAVVVSAMHLTDMTGVQLAEKLWSETDLSRVGFILITSQTDAKEANAPKISGTLARLTKPFDAARLSAALASIGCGAATTPSARRVLVADDSAAARAHIRRVLEGLGLRDITEVADGKEAADLLEKQTFDLVVTDYNMPRLDGRGLIDFIRHRSAVPSVPVIMVTTETDAGKLEAVGRLGVAAICDKSFPADVVGTVIAKLG